MGARRWGHDAKGRPGEGRAGWGPAQGGRGAGEGGETIAALDFPGLLVPTKPVGKLPGRPDGTSPGMSASPTPFFPPTDSIKEEEPADVDPPLVDADLELSLTWEEVESLAAQRGPLLPPPTPLGSHQPPSCVAEARLLPL